jgi:hypothetical protein
MPTKTSALLLSLLLLTVTLAVPDKVDALGIELEGRYWAPDLSGSVGLAGFDLPPGFPDINVTDLLGVEADGVLEGRFTFRILLGFYIRATYQKMNNSGGRSLEDLIGVPIPIEGGLNSNLDFDYGRLALGWRFVFPDNVFNIGAFAEAKGFSGDAGVSFTSPIFSESVAESFEAVIPSLGIVGEINPSERWSIFGEVSKEVGYDDASMLDWELGLRFFPTKIFAIGAGYRVMDLDGVLDNVIMKVEWKGAFLSAMLKF